jgi:putative membrane protein
MGGMGIGHGIVMLFFMLLFWGLLIFLAVWLVKVLFGNQRPKERDDHPLSAREILAKRYARGEITREQYEIMKQDIG